MIDRLLHILVAAVLTYASIKDCKTHEIPDRVHILLLLIGLSRVLFTQHSLWAALAGMLVGGGPLLLTALATDGIGGGDVKLMGSIGFVLGFPDTLPALILSLLLIVCLGPLYLSLTKQPRGAVPCTFFFLMGFALLSNFV